MRNFNRLYDYSIDVGAMSVINRLYRNYDYNIVLVAKVTDTNIQSENILLGNNAVKQVAYVGCRVDMNPNSATFGQIITGSSKVMVAE